MLKDNDIICQRLDLLLDRGRDDLAWLELRKNQVYIASDGDKKEILEENGEAFYIRRYHVFLARIYVPRKATKQQMHLNGHIISCGLDVMKVLRTQRGRI